MKNTTVRVLVCYGVFCFVLLTACMNPDNPAEVSTPPSVPEWKIVATAGSLSGGAQYLNLVFDQNDVPYTAFQEDVDKARVMKLVNGGWEYIPASSTGLSDGKSISESFQIYGGTPYIVYRDYSFSSKVVAMHYTGAETESDATVDDGWEYLGTGPFTTGSGQNISLDIDANGDVYAAFSDGSNSYRLTVIKYTGNTTSDSDEVVNDGWEYVGSPGISAGIPQYTDLKINPSENMPYVVFQDGGDSDKVRLAKFDGSSWSFVGGGSFSQYYVDYTNLSFDGDGNPYVVFTAMPYITARVMTFTGNTTDDSDEVANDGWEYVGSGPLTSERVFLTKIVIDSGGTPTVAFFDYASDEVVVMRYTGNTTDDTDEVANDGWEYIGDTSAYTTGSTGGDICLQLDSDDIPYVLFTDGDNEKKPTLITYQ